jgi:hypothetical protein
VNFKSLTLSKQTTISQENNEKNTSENSQRRKVRTTCLKIYNREINKESNKESLDLTLLRYNKIFLRSINKMRV